MRTACALLTVLLFGATALAEIHTEVVEYDHEGVTLEGYLAYDTDISGVRPGVMVAHEWTGLGDYAKSRTERLARLGYIAFAADIYGKGIRPQTSEEASAQATIYRSDRALMRARAAAGLEVLRRQKLCDPQRLAAIGYCFGGGVVLELARSGADLAGVVSFHGNLDTPNPDDAKQIKCSVLVAHGAADPYVNREQVEAFVAEMNAAAVDWYMIEYGGAVHSFTNPDSGSDPAKGAAYNEAADRRSWQAMQDFFAEIFK
ncbi:MAG: dienelactone hydrolase family protein [bacterium]